MYYYKKKNMYIFNDEEKRQAKGVSTLDYLEKNYGYHFKKAGSMYRCVEHDSLIIRSDCKGWYWNSRGIGGADVLEFVKKVESKTYEQALMTVLNITPDNNHVSKPVYSSAPKITEPVMKELMLPPRFNGTYKRVYAYLTKTRCIDPAIVTTLLHKNFLYEDMRHNCVFVGYNKTGLPAYAAVRTTNSDIKYRKDAIGSDKANGFYLKGYNKNTLFVFESPIDLLSHASICNLESNNNKAWLNSSRLSLGGVSDKALEKFLTDYPDVKKIVLCLDNDLAGQKACEIISDKFSKLGYEVETALPKNKDYNDDLKELMNAPKKVKQAKI